MSEANLHSDVREDMKDIIVRSLNQFYDLFATQTFFLSFILSFFLFLFSERDLKI